MKRTLGERFARWRAHPQKWEPAYLSGGLKAILRQFVDCREDSGESLLSPPIEDDEAEILFDPEFRSSVDQVKAHTCLDIARLANLWMFVRRCGPGTYLEVGSYRGGTARHICNAMTQPDSDFYCVDPFETGSYEKVLDWEEEFRPGDFMDTQQSAVEALLADKPFAHVVRGFFPLAVEPLNPHDIAFCHLDVNMYDATRKSLEYLAPRLANRSLIVVDDYGHRYTPGVARAVDDFTAENQDFVLLPLFPCQALLIPRNRW